MEGDTNQLPVAAKGDIAM
jgi:hypothetical protein